MEPFRFHLLLGLALVGLSTLALEDSLAVLVKLQLGDDNVGGVNADGDGLAVGLVPGDPLDVDNVLETVHAGNLALATLVGPTNNGDFVVLADRERANLKRNTPSAQLF